MDRAPVPTANFRPGCAPTQRGFRPGASAVRRSRPPPLFGLLEFGRILNWIRLVVPERKPTALTFFVQLSEQSHRNGTKRCPKGARAQRLLHVQIHLADSTWPSTRLASFEPHHFPLITIKGVRKPLVCTGAYSRRPYMYAVCVRGDTAARGKWIDTLTWDRNWRFEALSVHMAHDKC